MDVKAIIFLAPISVFDEKVEGDARTNRLEDSVKLWTTVCKSKLLTKVIPAFGFASEFVLMELTSQCHDHAMPWRVGAIDPLPQQM